MPARLVTDDNHLYVMVDRLCGPSYISWLLAYQNNNAQWEDKPTPDDLVRFGGLTYLQTILSPAEARTNGTMYYYRQLTGLLAGQMLSALEANPAPFSYYEGVTVPSSVVTSSSSLVTHDTTWTGSAGATAWYLQMTGDVAGTPPAAQLLDNGIPQTDPNQVQSASIWLRLIAPIGQISAPVVDIAFVSGQGPLAPSQITAEHLIYRSRGLLPDRSRVTAQLLSVALFHGGWAHYVPTATDWSLLSPTDPFPALSNVYVLPGTESRITGSPARILTDITTPLQPPLSNTYQTVGPGLEWGEVRATCPLVYVPLGNVAEV